MRMMEVPLAQSFAGFADSLCVYANRCLNGTNICLFVFEKARATFTTPNNVKGPLGS